MLCNALSKVHEAYRCTLCDHSWVRLDILALLAPKQQRTTFLKH